MTIPFISLTFTLFLLMDPIGNIPPFLSMTEELTSKRRRLVLLREMGVALLAMLFFCFIGEYLIALLKVSLTTVRFSSAVILFFTAIKVLFPASDSLRANLPKAEPFITPFAIPLIAGPSLLATIMLVCHSEESHLAVLAAILLAWAVALLILLNSSFLARYLGSNGLMAGERLIGMILILIAVQRFSEGLYQFIMTCCEK